MARAVPHRGLAEASALRGDHGEHGHAPAAAGDRVDLSLPQPEASNLPGFTNRSALWPAASHGRHEHIFLAPQYPLPDLGDREVP